MQSNFGGIVVQLRDELAAVRGEIEADRAAIIAPKEAREKQILGALKCLEDSPKYELLKQMRPGKSCATKDDVLEAVTQILGENDTVPADDLKALVYDKLRERFDLKGAAMRLREVLADQRFDQTESGVYRLAASHPM